MTEEAMSPLRRRMIEDMTIRKLAPKTQHDYVQRIKNFAGFLGRSPDTATFEDVRRYQLHLAASGVGVPTINQTVPRSPRHLHSLGRHPKPFTEAGIARQPSHIRNVRKSRHAKPAECRDPYQKENCLEAAVCAMGEATVSIILNSAFGVQAV